MRQQHFFLRFDFCVQILLFSILLLTIFSSVFEAGFLFLSMLVFLLIGAWQVFSAGITALLLKSSLRSIYFAASVIYCFFLGYGGSLLDHLPWKDATGFLVVLFLFVVPFIGAIWYLYLTINFVKGEEEEEIYCPNPK